MFDVNPFKSGAIKICDIDLEVKEKAKVLRFQKNKETSDAIVCKCTI